MVVDASTPLLQVGVADRETWKSMATSEKQVLEGLFAAVEKSMEKAGESLSKIGTIFYFEGPGSTLGLRIAATFVRTLQWANKPEPKLYVYNALDMAKVIEPAALSIQAPFRRGFRFVRTGEEAIGKKDILSIEEAREKHPESMHFPDPRNPGEEIKESSKINYQLEKQVRGLSELIPISKIEKIATPYAPRPTEFKKWQPRQP